MAFKNIKGHSTLLIMRKIQGKTTLKCQFLTLSNWQRSRHLILTSKLWDLENQILSYITIGNVNRYSLYRENLGIIKILNAHTFDPAVSLLRLYPTDLFAHVPRTFTVVLFVTAGNYEACWVVRNQPKEAMGRVSLWISLFF